MVKVTGPIAACIAGTQSRVFYVDDNDNFLHYLTNRENSDGETIATKDKARRNYLDDLVTIDNKDVKSFTKDIAAISFPLANGTTRTRIYYINESGYLAELAREGEGDWKFGTLDSKKFPAIKDTPITACLSPASDTIKVFYYRANTAQSQNAPWVAWVNGKTGEWNTQALIPLA